jgi:HAD superfamily hydrolase (TIGR01549 family)
MLRLPIETVIFDLDGTLRHHVPSANDVQIDFISEFGIPDYKGMRETGARWSHYYWAQSSELFSDIDACGEMDGFFWENYSLRYLLSIGVKEKQANGIAPLLADHMENCFDPQDQIHPCVPKTLSSLNAAGYALGLISNRSSPCHEYCESTGLADYFQFAYVAAEVDAWKPDPRIFDRALGITNSRPESTVYVGDNYYADVVGAKNAGIQPILFDPESIFPDADCLVIKRIQDLQSLL